MNLRDTLDRLHAEATANRWLRFLSVFSRMALAAGFIPSGMVKILGERFTSLSPNHPMGHYLDALYQTGYYYTFIGITQVTAAVLLLIPRTVVLGALIYFPIILNICILSYAVRFDGSHMTSPLMVLADLYLLCWHYDKLKFILPFHHRQHNTPSLIAVTNKFPWRFFGAVTALLIAGMFFIRVHFSIMPRNTLSECRKQFTGTHRTKAGFAFCDCIHNQGNPLDTCLENYKKAPNEAFTPETQRIQAFNERDSEEFPLSADYFLNTDGYEC